jgi:hypothetical protein
MNVDICIWRSDFDSLFHFGQLLIVFGELGLLDFNFLYGVPEIWNDLLTVFRSGWISRLPSLPPSQPRYSVKQETF